MRFPWLQVDADFIAAHAGDLGSYLGISRREAMGLALDLWTWALARASDDAPPDGLVTGTGPVPDRLLSGSVGWTGPAELLSEALLTCGLMVRVDGGYRLTGFSRYKATWERNRRRTGGKPDRYRSGTGEKPERKTQTQTHIKEEAAGSPPSAARQEGRRYAGQTRPTALVAAIVSGGEQARLLDVASEPPRVPQGRTPTEMQLLYQALQATRQRRCEEVGEPFVPDGWGIARQNTVLNSLAKGPGEAKARFESAWGIYLADEGERARTPAWSLGWFMAGGVRARYETMAAREAVT